MRNTFPLAKFLVGAAVLGVFAAQGCAAVESDVRTKEGLVKWRFCEDTSPEGSPPVIPQEAAWTELSIPHVFRLSGLHEQSAGWYRTSFAASKAEAGKRFWLLLEGAGSVADVFVNGEPIGRHRGAFTAAAFDLTKAVKFGQDNDLAIRVTNRDTEAADCLSQSNLYYTNGGLYRPAWLIKTSAVHIYPDMGSTGVYLTPKNIGKDSADLEVRTYIRNGEDRPVEVRLVHTVTGPDGRQCARFETTATIPAGQIQPVTTTQTIDHPKLWDIRQPNLYTVKTEVIAGGRTVDALTERTGFRTIAMKDGCFMLNGKELLARGVCKHHQGEHQWNAMTDEDLRAEMEGMIDLGCNTIRLAHYPHRRFEYHLADEAGLAVWAENGLAGQKWDGDVKRETTPNADGERITREMVRQNWNHPSIIFWSSGNETYQEVASHYADIIRREDTTRLITYASAGEKPANVDFVAGNTYQGWYWGHYTDFHRLPENAFISETGSGSWITHHLPYGTQRWDVDKFESEEYNELFAEYRFQTIFRNNPSGHKMFLWWNFREFYNKKFKGNRNTKGIWTLAGMPKDFYYLYQSFLRPDEPVLHLCGRHHFYRQFAPDNGIKAFSNADEVELFINGVSQGVKKNGDYVQPDSTKKENNKTIPVKGIAVNNVFFWKAPLRPGKNTVEVRDNRGRSASMVIYQKAEDGAMPVPADSLVVNLKSSNADNPAIFIDRPVEPQGPFYSEVDGSSDNTFDVLPKAVEGARWITTKRLSDAKNKTDLSFRVTRPATVYVMYATGTFPAHTLHEPYAPAVQASAALTQGLQDVGFNDTGIRGVWRRHGLWLGDYGLMSRTVEAGEDVVIGGQTLDYVVLIKPN
jgi:beta-galactosidase